MSQRSEDVLPAWLAAWVSRAARLGARYPVVVDLSLAVGTVGVSLTGLHSQGRLGGETVGFALALCAPLLLRRRKPILALGAIAVVAFLQWLLSAPQLADASVLFALYWVARESALPRVAVASLAVEAGAVIAAWRWSPSDPVKVWVGLSGLTVAASVLGVTVRQRRALLSSLQDKAARLEFERDQEGRLAAAGERARIAREMHDIVSHNLTVMIALADGASYAMQAAPEQALPAMQRVSATGRQALAEMRRLLGMLRDEPGGDLFAPQPSLARLDDLLTRVEAAGIPVSVDLEGDLHALGEGVQLAVFRVAQEALTNTLKHAVSPTQAHLRLRCCGRQVELEVTDDGRALAGVTLGTAPEHGEAGPSGGRGLRGMRERAAAYGGAVDAGPLANGGWRVHLRIDSDAEAGVA